MVVAKLHIICGNCGSTDLAYHRKEVDEEGDHSYLECKDCATLHFLSDINDEGESSERIK